MQIGQGEFWLGDCLERMADIPDGSVDMVLCDLPYGTTACKWDSVIPFDLLWEQYWRVIRDDGAVVLTASQPFTSALVMSQVGQFKCSWVWNKRASGNPGLAKYQPLKIHEDVCVFGRNTVLYHPQKIRGRKRLKGGKAPSGSTQSGRLSGYQYESDTYYPKSIVEFSKDRGLHPTQKPVALFEYLIRTYTDSDMLVLDNCAGSGTTAIAAERTGRRWLCIEREPSYYYRAVGRVWAEVQAS